MFFFFLTSQFHYIDKQNKIKQKTNKPHELIVEPWVGQIKAMEQRGDDGTLCCTGEHL